MISELLVMPICYPCVLPRPGLVGLPNRVCSWRRNYGTRGGTRFARVHRAILLDPSQLKPFR